MFARLAPGPETLGDIVRVECLVRDRFEVPAPNLILVSQDPGRKPGFPPQETNVVFWKNAKRYRLKIFAPVSRVREADLPVGWLLPSLEDDGGADCC